MSYLEEAHEILSQVKGRPLNLEERKNLSIELASLMLQEANRSITSEEKKVQKQLSRLMEDPSGKAFTTAMTDQAFRSTSHRRVAEQMIYLLSVFGIPRYFNALQRAQLYIFKVLGPSISRFLVPFVARALRKQASKVILPAEPGVLKKHLEQRRAQGVRINLNHLGEAILSEKEAKNRLQNYLDDLKNPDIDYISIKISTIYSQIHLIAYEQSRDAIAERLRVLYRAAMQFPEYKFVNLDMEEYRDLHLTVAVFCKVLDEVEFHSYSAGIVLQAYLPDSFEVQKQLTQWAKRRIKDGGAPIKIRIVKGANLAMEQFEASLKDWPQAPYTSKLEVDANYKRMITYGLELENARAVRIGIASHNLFDIAFAMLLRLENQVEAYTGFEMLEGMADHIRKVVQKLTGNMLLYCPVAMKHEFQHAIAYLIRRLDENTAPENFLRHVFGLRQGTASWDNQTALFERSIKAMDTVSAKPRRTQNKQLHPETPEESGFENEPDTDFALEQNRKWAENIASHWEHVKPKPIPLVYAGKEHYLNEEGQGLNPSNPSNVKPLYIYAKAQKSEIEEALKCAVAQEKVWGKTTVEHRSQLLANVAQKLRERHGELIGAMMLDAGKTIAEADPEVSEAIDFAEYYRRQIEKIAKMQDLHVKPKGTILVTPPWNFPCSIPAGGILAALATGNCVIFKPASDAVLIGWHLANAFWDAGISKEVLQFLPCSGEEIGSSLIQDPRIRSVILTGGTSTAKKFLKMRPGLDLAAELGGKNSFIVTALSDRDLAIKNLIQSAFGHSGQKCSAASLAILEKEVYDDVHFLQSLKEAAASLKVGSAFDLETKVNPLIHEAKGVLARALTTLEPGETWLLEPVQDEKNPCLWSPGIKMGVKEGSFTHMTELFGPVLALMRANNLEHAIQIANAVPYGLTAGLQSLDNREQKFWIDNIEAGNLYVNRTITGAIVRRQPFGGCKASSFGSGSKAGGPNYLREFLHFEQIALPKEKGIPNELVNSLATFLDAIDLTPEDLALWTASCMNYAYWWDRLKEDKDPSQVVGQDNFLRYVPRKNISLRIGDKSLTLNELRICAAALTCGAQIEISYFETSFDWQKLSSYFPVYEESEEKWVERINQNKIERIRTLEPVSHNALVAAADAGAYIIHAPVLANGRLELLHYLREISISIDYHRYGNLGVREGEPRKPIL